MVQGQIQYNWIIIIIQLQFKLEYSFRKSPWNCFLFVQFNSVQFNYIMLRERITLRKNHKFDEMKWNDQFGHWPLQCESHGNWNTLFKINNNKIRVHQSFITSLAEYIQSHFMFAYQIINDNNWDVFVYSIEIHMKFTYEVSVCLPKC